MKMKRIDTQGIIYIEPLEGSGEWYWGTDYAGGDLYEAEELFRSHYVVKRNELIFVHYPEGTVISPVIAEEGQYFGRPICYLGRIVILKVDFPAEKIMIVQFDPTSKQVEVLTELPLSAVENCYNLMLKTMPLMLTRQGNDDKFQILWPEKTEFQIGNAESFLFRSDESLYFSAWWEDPEYREEILIRDMNTGKIVDRIPGGFMEMPDGQIWILA